MKHPDQIRRETVPAKHYALLLGFTGLMFGACLSFGGWALLHWEQVRWYPQYCGYAIRIAAGDFGGSPVRTNSDALRYSLLRWGNRDHSLDRAILARGWYPKTLTGAVGQAEWVRYYGNVPGVYDGQGAADVLRWPLALTALVCFVFACWGIALDYRYRSAIIAGLHLDGSIVATVGEYNREVKGDGMRYRLAEWKDR